MADTAIKKAMDERGLTSARVAETVGVTRQAVEAWCRGEYMPDKDNARVLMPLLGLTWDEIYPPSKKVSNG